MNIMPVRIISPKSHVRPTTRGSIAMIDQRRDRNDMSMRINTMVKVAPTIQGLSLRISSSISAAMILVLAA